MNFTDVLKSVVPHDGGMRVDIPDSWRQGRTAYGGLTAALCLHAARELTGETRALRSAMISFVGPSVEDFTLRAEPLRSGKTISSIASNLYSAGTPATQTVLSFADLRDDSTLDVPAPAAPNVDVPESGVEIPPNMIGTVFPSFIQMFEFHPIGGVLPFSGGDATEITWWVRHRDPASHTGEAALVCIADVLPPAALVQLTAPTPMSSATWMTNFLQSSPTTDDGWWLLQVRARHASGGFSSQEMTIWNTRGECVVTGSQMVIVFA